MRQDYRHDVKDVIKAMDGYIINDDFEGLKKFFREYVLSAEQKFEMLDSIIANLKNMHILELKSILGIKLESALNLEIDINVEICDPIYEIDMYIIDLIRVVNILFDNAIEECKKQKGMKLQLAIVKTNQFTKIIVVNELVEPILDVSILFGENYSTKGENRGIGLPSLRRILSGYSNITLETYTTGAENTNCDKAKATITFEITIYER